MKATRIPRPPQIEFGETFSAVGKPFVRLGRTWQTFASDDPTCEFIIEHDVTRDEWWKVED